MRCAESLRVQAYFDGEVDALAAQDIERHCQACRACGELLEDLNEVRAMLRRDADRERAPAALRTRIRRALDGDGAPSRWRVLRMSREFWQGVLGGAVMTTLVAGLVFLVLQPSRSGVLTDELVSAHVHSMMPDHLIAVVSSDRHTVKPWFGAHADVSPVVADFAAQGFALVGGRADYLVHQRAAVVVYRHDAHVINVFSWADVGPRLPNRITRNGYHLVFWNAGNVAHCAVSDAAWDEVDGLVRLLKALETRDDPE